jgi:hypothetical protein
MRSRLCINLFYSDFFGERGQRDLENLDLLDLALSRHGLNLKLRHADAVCKQNHHGCVACDFRPIWVKTPRNRILNLCPIESHARLSQSG